MRRQQRRDLPARSEIDEPITPSSSFAGFFLQCTELAAENKEGACLASGKSSVESRTRVAYIFRYVSSFSRSTFVGLAGDNTTTGVGSAVPQGGGIRVHSIK